MPDLLAERAAQAVYLAETSNHPTIHCNRFPSWSELPEAERARRIASIESGTKTPPPASANDRTAAMDALIADSADLIDAPAAYEGLSEAMYSLSAQLAMTGWLDDDTNHAMYERVVKQWQALPEPALPPASADALGEVPRLPRNKLLYGSPDYLDDTEGLERWRDEARRGHGHDMASVNINSLRRLIDTIDRLTAALSAMSPAGEVEQAVLAERERCAKIVEARVEPSWHLAAKNAAYVIAKAIREPKP